MDRVRSWVVTCITKVQKKQIHPSATMLPLSNKLKQVSAII